jgi:hypothetical protein
MAAVPAPASALKHFLFLPEELQVLFLGVPQGSPRSRRC